MFFVAAGSVLFADDFALSAGLGGLAGGAFTRYAISANGPVGPLDQAQTADQFNYGAFAFFDATYGILSLSLQNGMSANDDGGMLYDSWETMLSIGLLGKYPFYLTDRLTLFPLLGMEYQICLVKLRKNADTDIFRWNDDDTFFLQDWNTFFVNLGVGLDVALTKNFFIRSELLYNIRLMSPYEEKFLNGIKADTLDPNPKLAGLSSGPSIRISIGYRFDPIPLTKKTPAETAAVEPAAVLIPEMPALPEKIVEEPPVIVPPPVIIPEEIIIPEEEIPDESLINETLSSRVYAEGMRMSAMANKSEAAVPELFLEAEEVYKNAESAFNDLRYEEAIELYGVAEALFENAIVVTEEKRVVAEEMLLWVLQKTDESAAFAEEAENILSESFTPP